MLDQWAAALLHPWRKQRGGGSGAAVWRKKGRDVEEEGRAAAAVAEEPVTYGRKTEEMLSRSFVLTGRR